MARSGGMFLVPSPPGIKNRPFLGYKLGNPSYEFSEGADRRKSTELHRIGLRNTTKAGIARFDQRAESPGGGSETPVTGGEGDRPHPSLSHVHPPIGLGLFADNVEVRAFVGL